MKTTFYMIAGLIQSKRIITFFLVSILLGCSKKEEVKLEILNTQVTAIERNEPFSISSNLTYSNAELGYAKNIIQYQLTNNTKNKYVFFADEDGLIYDEHLNTKGMFDFPLACFSFGLEDSNKNKPKYISFYSENINLLQKAMHTEEVEKVKLLKNAKNLDLHVPFESLNNINLIRKNYIVLHPGESRIFKTILYLPIENEINELNTRLSFFQFLKDKSYKFKITYSSGAKSILKLLPKYKRDEFVQNDLKIFNGSVVSNKVPIIFFKK